MKRIIKLGKKQFVHLDSYVVKNQGLRDGLVTAGLMMMIAALAIGAMMGADVTEPSLKLLHEENKDLVRN